MTPKQMQARAIASANPIDVGDIPDGALVVGAVAGDIIGSRHEFSGEKLKSLPPDFPLFPEGSAFTDDTLMTVATMHALMKMLEFGPVYREFGRAYPHLGYGARFKRWLLADSGPYQSFGNGAAMRVSPVGWIASTSDQALDYAGRSAAPTHDHPEGIKGAQAVALAIFRAIRGAELDEIRDEVQDRVGYDLSRPYEEIQADYCFDETCQGTVPAAFAAVFAARDYESAVRNAIRLGGDADTLAAIAGSIAEAVWGVPEWIQLEVARRLPPDLLLVLRVFSRYTRRFHYGREWMIRQSRGLA